MLHLAIPVVIAEIGWISMGIVDTVIVGPLGPAAIGAVGTGSTMFMGLMVFGMGMVLALDTFVAQSFGAGRIDDCHRWLFAGLQLAIVLSIILIVISLGGLSSAIYNEVLQFFVIVAALLPIVIVGLVDVGGWNGLMDSFKNTNVGEAGLHAFQGTSPGNVTNPIGSSWIGLVFGLGFVLSFGYWTTNFAEVQRALSAKNLSAAQRTPLIGAFLGFLLMVAVTWIFRRWRPSKLDHLFRRLQLLSAGLYSLGHGGNDAQKTMGIITGLLVASGQLKKFDVPLWVVLISHAAIALGTMFGGWRIVKTMGQKITKLKPVGGFCAETGGAITLFLATALGIPVSTTHTITGAIMGVGAAKKVSAVRWNVANGIILAWIITIPASGIIAALAYAAVGLFT